MKKIVSIFFLVTAVLVLAGCKNPKQNGEEMPSASKASIKDLLTKGVAQKCQVEINNETMQSSAEIWIKDKKFKQVNTSKNVAGVGDMTTNVISDGEWVYSWNSANPKQGVKFPVDNTNETGNTKTEDYQQSWTEWEQNTSFKCNPAVISDSEFDVPAGVSFVDFEAQMKEIQNKAVEEIEMPEDLKKAQCQTCDQTPNDESASECRKIFNCD